MTIYLGLLLPTGSSNLPGIDIGNLNSQFGLAPDGVYHAFNVTIEAVSSYLAFSTLPRKLDGIFSVALSVGSPRPAVNGHPAYRSSDFPLFKK